MAELVMLTPEQVAERERPKGPGRVGRRRSAERTRIIEEYKAVLQQAQPGYGGDVLLSEANWRSSRRFQRKACSTPRAVVTAATANSTYLKWQLYQCFCLQ